GRTHCATTRSTRATIMTIIRSAPPQPRRDFGALQKAELNKSAGQAAGTSISGYTESYAGVAWFRRRRAKARRPAHAAIKPGIPAPGMGPGTARVVAENVRFVPPVGSPPVWVVISNVPNVS